MLLADFFLGMIAGFALAYLVSAFQRERDYMQLMSRQADLMRRFYHNVEHEREHEERRIQ
jgi:hypothetical protein